MKKTSTRLASIGGIVILGAFAIALAQHDARKRDRDEPLSPQGAPQPAIPISLEDEDGEWNTGRFASTKLVVRGNNELPQIAPSNPLRTAAVDENLDDSQVVPAGAGFPSDPPATASLGDKPPAWLGDATGSKAQSVSDEKSLLPAMPSFPGGQTQSTSPAGLPSFPMNPTAPTESSVRSPGNPMPSLANQGPTQPPTITSNIGDMSDTQRGALPPTNLMPGDRQPTIQSAASYPNALPQPPGGMSTTNQTALPQMPPGSLQTPLPTTPSTAGGATSGGSPVPTIGGVAPYASPYAPQAANTRPPQYGAGPTGVGTTGVGTADAGTTGVGDWPSSGGNTPPRTTATAALAGLVSNKPGDRYLDGSQNPNLVIQKRAPEEIQVGKKTTFVISVRNAGNTTAHGVRVVDSVPVGVRFVEAAPAATPDSQGIISWSLGEMAAGEERTITLQIVPEVQGEIGSNAVVYFAALASVRTMATMPKLELDLRSSPDMLIGTRQQVSVVVKSTGSGVARGVRLEADLPELLKHDSGESQLAAGLGDLAPAESQPITLDITAVQPGQATIVIRAVSNDGATAEQTVGIDVLAPEISASIAGPRLRYLERQATYVISVLNSGTATARNLDFVMRLPAGLKFNSANNRGSYDPAKHAVRWGLEELPAGATAPVELTVLPVELGPQMLSFTASGDSGLQAEAKGQLTVDGLAELSFTIGQDNGTIEVGASTTYTVQLSNVGNKPDRDVRLAVQLPNGAKLVDVAAQVGHRAEGNQIIFEAIPEMRNKDLYTFRFQVQHNQPGTQIVRTQLTSENWPVAVIKEEGTLVYNDQN